ncbi:hypothetical protein ACHAWC_004047 [Mediolabrus comicus]
MADTRAQLAEVDALIAASPDEPSLLQLREDLLQLIALEELEKSSGSTPAAAATAENYSELQNNEQQQQQQGGEVNAQHVEESSEQHNYSSANYTAQSTFTDNIGTDSLAEAPDLGSFQPVAKSTHIKSTSTTSSTTQAASLKTGDDEDDNNNVEYSAAAAASTSEKKKKKKKKSDDKLLSSKFELPNHLIPLDSDTDAQKQKKQRAAKALKSKFRSKQKEMEHTKRANDWKSFSTKASKKNKKLPKSSIFSTEEGVNAKVGVISGGGSGRTMTGYSEQGKHKFS